MAAGVGMVAAAGQGNKFLHSGHKLPGDLSSVADSSVREYDPEESH